MSTKYRNIAVGVACVAIIGGFGFLPAIVMRNSVSLLLF